MANFAHAQQKFNQIGLIYVAIAKKSPSVTKYGALNPNLATNLISSVATGGGIVGTSPRQPQSGKVMGIAEIRGKKFCVGVGGGPVRST